MLVPENITGLILAGGAGRRVEGQDKGLLSYKGEILIERQINWLKPQVASLMISANRHVEHYSKFGYPVITDEPLTSDGSTIKGPTFEGPLRGIYQGLLHCKTPWLFIQPIDTPCLPNDLLQQLIDKTSPSGDCYYLRTTERAHYLSMLIRSSMKSTLKEFIQLGNPRVRDYHQLIDSRPIDLGISEAQFKNLNHIPDYH